MSESHKTFVFHPQNMFFIMKTCLGARCEYTRGEWKFLFNTGLRLKFNNLCKLNCKRCSATKCTRSFARNQFLIAPLPQNKITKSDLPLKSISTIPPPPTHKITKYNLPLKSASTFYLPQSASTIYVPQISEYDLPPSNRNFWAHFSHSNTILCSQRSFLRKTD